MAIRLIIFTIGIVLFTGFLWFFAQVMWFGMTEFFRRRRCVKPEEREEMHDIEKNKH